MERSITGETAEIFSNVAFAMTEYWFDSLVITLFIVTDEVIPVPFLLVGYDFRELIDFELLVFGRV